jgi:hypothetical protein
MNRTGLIFSILSSVAVVSLLALLLPSAMVSVSKATNASQCKTLEEDIEIEFSGDLEGVSMYDLLSHYLENPPAIGSDNPGRMKQFGGC